jgi:hypothetical protein
MHYLYVFSPMSVTQRVNARLPAEFPGCGLSSNGEWDGGILFKSDMLIEWGIAKHLRECRSLTERRAWVPFQLAR